MTWHKADSEKRVRDHLDNMGPIEVKDYTKVMDLDSLSETVCRRIFGAHVYGEIGNLSALVGKRTTKEERQELIQATHLYQREVAEIAGAIGAERIHFQGGRAHLLIHHPIKDEQGIATKAVLLQLVLDRFGEVFNEEFPDLEDVRIRSGADMGYAIATRNGAQGDRELLFIGSPTNHAAKLLAPGAPPRRLTAAIADVLPDDLSAFVIDDEEKDGADGDYELLAADAEELEELLDAYGIVWSEDACRTRLQADKVRFRATAAGLRTTELPIDFDDLSFSRSKLADAATLYGDVSGFTKFVDDAVTEYQQEQALRTFHAIRREMATVVAKDHKGIRVQFQGDRVQAIFHVPKDDDAGICSEAIEAAAALQSSFEHVLKAELPSIASMGLAVGISRGDTIAARLGEYAHRDRICLGPDVLRAEQNEERVGKFETGISGNVRDHLDQPVRDLFVWDASKGCHVAAGLDQDVLDLARITSAKSAYVAPAAAGAVISTVPGSGRVVRPAASYGPDR
jgi:class 3 adenylate cyclase